ncbi:NAD(P)/FAD-dependent oxidoreductase [Rhodococcus opacus]|nr:NAD(P)/FAD-dependent oxidoreductase [Rhodococcus opacus]
MSSAVESTAAAGSAFADELRQALAVANLPTLLLVLHQLTGDQRWLEAPYRPTPARGLSDHDDAGLPPAVQDEIRDAAFKVISAWKTEELPPTAPATPEKLVELLGISLAEEVPVSYADLLAEEMGTVSRQVEIAGATDKTDFRVLIVGAGMAGLNLAIMLKAAGVPFAILEKNYEVGGTWLENRYPGCGVDTPSHLYSFSFAKSSQWSTYFGKRDEVHAYFVDLAREHNLYDNIEFGTEVVQAAWDGEDKRWRIHVRRSGGSEEVLDAPVFVSAVGHFNRPSIPDIPGLASFPGRAVHTAQWSNDLDVTGKRVAVIGSGASAMQIVPALAGVASNVLVYQRSRQWAVPHPNHGRAVTSEVQWLLENVPYYAGFYRLRQFWRFGDRLHPALQIDESYPDPAFAVNEVNAAHRRFLTKYIESELDGRPDLIAASVPEYPAYGKRPLIDHGWYRTLRRDDVELLDGGLREIRGSTLVGHDGQERDVDMIVFATGFQTLRILGPMEVVGRDGERLRDVWGEDDARAYLGMSVPHFPNFFMLFGPNTSTGHGGSAFLTTEMQVRYLMQLIKAMLEQHYVVVEVRPDVHQDYNEQVDDALAKTVWTHPSVTNYYRNRGGRIVGTSPWEYVAYWRRTREVDLNDYHLEPATTENEET